MQQTEQIRIVSFVGTHVFIVGFGPNQAGAIRWYTLALGEVHATLAM